MSGGVDSSTAAYLLQKSGFDVTGLFVFFQSPEKMAEQLASAKSVADFLNIKLNTLDLSEKFSQEIINDFIAEYKSGNTPNPCIRCNKYFKFGKLLDYTKQNGFDFFATGHYARTLKHLNTKTLKHNYKLITAKDKSKDQSYFLYNLNSKILSHILFPLGEYYKSDVKKLATEINLPVRQSKESTDVCFIDANLREFLKSRISANPGDIVNTENKKVGEHIGLPFYTLGQRQGIEIGGTGPYYVVKKDFVKNELIVTNDKNDPQLFSTELFVKDINWIFQKPDLPIKCLAQHRYQAKMGEVSILPLLTKEGAGGRSNYKPHPNPPLISKFSNRKFEGEGAKIHAFLVKYKKPQRAITSGQSIVFYKPLRKFFNKDFEVLGGGVIETKN